MNDPVLIACTFNALTKVQLAGMPFSCWFHFEDPDPPNLAEVVRSVVASGCVRIFVSGVDAAGVHDRIDDVLIAIDGVDIPTIWQSVSLPEMAWEFLYLAFTPTNADVKVVSVFAEQSDVGVERLSELLSALKQVIADEGK